MYTMKIIKTNTVFIRLYRRPAVVVMCSFRNSYFKREFKRWSTLSGSGPFKRIFSFYVYSSNFTKQRSTKRAGNPYNHNSPGYSISFFLLPIETDLNRFKHFNFSSHFILVINGTHCMGDRIEIVWKNFTLSISVSREE